MKRFVWAIVLLLSLAALPVHAVQVRSVDDVIRMHRAGVDGELLLAIVQTPHQPFEVTDADVAAMREAGVPQDVIDAVMATSLASAEAAAAELRAAEAAQAESAQSTAAVWGDWCITLEPVFPLFWPDYGMIPSWIWDPYWFMPRYDSTIGKQRPPAAAAAEARGGSRPRASRRSIADLAADSLRALIKAGEPRVKPR